MIQREKIPFSQTVFYKKNISALKLDLYTMTLQGLTHF